MKGYRKCTSITHHGLLFQRKKKKEKKGKKQRLVGRLVCIYVCVGASYLIFPPSMKISSLEKKKSPNYHSPKKNPKQSKLY